MPLTAKQERFCAEFVVDLNATQAAVRAGYSEGTARQQGSRLLTNADIQRRLAELQAEIRADWEVTLEEVISGLRREMARASEKGQHAAAIKALELLGKRAGAFVERVDVTLGRTPLDHRFASEEEAREALRAALGERSR